MTAPRRSGKETNIDWPFSDPPNVATFTVRQIVYDGAQIVYVSHDADDGAWQFLPGFEVPAGSVLVLTLSEIVEIDPSIREIADLPLGWAAHRNSTDEPWMRTRHP